MRYREVVFFLIFRPTPSCLLSSVCLLKLSPAPGRRKELATADLLLRV